MAKRPAANAGNDRLRIRICAEFGTEEFDDAYQSALRGERPAKRGGRVGTLEWLITRYKETTAWSLLSVATRRQREGIFNGVIKTAGREQFSKINRKSIVASMDRRKTPASARHFLEAMRGLFVWALDAEHVASDPTRDIKAPRKSTDGHHTWTDDEVVKFEARWPVGTRQRLAFDVLLFTGLRRGDAVRLGRQHVKDGIARIKTEKTGQEVTLPILPPLADSIAATPTADLAYISGEGGEPLTKESFGNYFADWCKKAGVPGRAHGLRKAGATRAPNNGATVAQLEALFGWRGGGMASLYTKKADRERLSKEAAEKLMPNIYSRTSAESAGQKPRKKGKSNA